MSLSSRSPASISEILGLLVAVAVLGVGFLPPGVGVVSHEAWLTLAVFGFTVVLWISKPIPYAISSLLSVVLLYALGLSDSFEGAVGGFTSSLVFFMILLLLIGESVSKVDLDEWIASRLVSATSTPQSTVRKLASTILLLVFIMPSSLARMVAFVPIIDHTNEVYRLDDDSPFRRLSYYITSHLNPIGSLALMTGGGGAIAAAGLISSSLEPITWVEWGLYMTPPVVAVFAVCVTAAGLLFDVDTDLQIREAEVRTDGSSGDVDTAGSLSGDQRIVVGTLLVAIVLWIVGSFAGIPTILPAMLVVLALSLPGVRIITAGELREINWGIVFLFGAMLSLLDVIQRVDAFEFVIDILTAGLPMWAPEAVIIAVLFGVAVLVRGLFSSASASYIVLFPIVFEVGERLAANSLYAALGLTIVLMSATFLPFNNPTVLLGYEQGPLRLSEVFLLGLLTLSMSCLVVALSWLFYWPLLDGFLVALG